MATSRNQKQELLVWGFIREIEKVYKIMNVPFEINDIIYLYQRIYDEWSKKYSSDNVIINNDTKSMLTINTKEYVTAFGSHIVTEGVFKWKIQMQKMTNKPGFGKPPFVGIMEDSEANLKRYKDDCNWDDNGYQFCAQSGALFCPYTEREKKTDKYECRWMQKGEILHVILDLNDKTLSFKVNDEDFGVAFKNIKHGNYRLAFSTWECKGSEFVLLE